MPPVSLTPALPGHIMFACWDSQLAQAEARFARLAEALQVVPNILRLTNVETIATVGPVPTGSVERMHVPAIYASVESIESLFTPCFASWPFSSGRVDRCPVNGATPGVAEAPCRCC